jgi:hypothetical protein
MQVALVNDGPVTFLIRADVDHKSVSNRGNRTSP